jgi:dephospho-CoA kinase
VRLGLTGGIGSGKSTVAAMLVDCGAALVDTDAIARRLTGARGAAMPALIAAFGPSVATSAGALDRDRMRELALSDATLRKRLEAVLHPMIGAEALREADAAGTDPIVFDVPLLTESSVWRARVERVVVVDCSERTQVQRVQGRPGWTEVSARQAIAAQSSRAARRAIADAIIVNEGIDLDALRGEVRALWRLWNNRRDR